MEFLYPDSFHSKSPTEAKLHELRSDAILQNPDVASTPASGMFIDVHFAQNKSPAAITPEVRIKTQPYPGTLQEVQRISYGDASEQTSTQDIFSENYRERHCWDELPSANNRSNNEGGIACLPYVTLFTAGQAAPALLDRATLKAANIAENSLLDTWSKLSPTAHEYRKLSEGLKSGRIAQSVAVQELESSSAQVAKLAKNVESMLEKLQAMQDSGKGSKLVNMKIDFLTDLKKITSIDAIESVLGNTKELGRGEKIFVRGGKEAKLLDEFARTLQGNEGAKIVEKQSSQAVKVAEEAIAKVSSQVDQLAKSQLKKGLLYSGGSVCAGYTLDGFFGQMFGYQPKNNSFRLFMDGVVVPAAIQAPLGRFKPAAIITAEVLARIAAATGI